MKPTDEMIVDAKKPQSTWDPYSALTLAISDASFIAYFPKQIQETQTTQEKHHLILSLLFPMSYIKTVNLIPQAIRTMRMT